MDGHRTSKLTPYDGRQRNVVRETVSAFKVIETSAVTRRQNINHDHDGGVSRFNCEK